MNMHSNPKDGDRISEARNSFAGRLLTNSQFNEAMVITGIIESEIKKSGTFRDKLGDYAHAFARTEKFDVLKAETTLRDLFKARTGQSMNEMREQLMEREKSLGDVDSDLVKDFTRAIGPIIKDGDKMPFYRAYDVQAEGLAEELGITNNAAKKIMTETFRNEANAELYDWGKSLEEKYYRPQIEAEKQQREKPAQVKASRQSRPRNG